MYCYVLNFFFFFFCILRDKANEIKYIKSCHFDLSSFFNEGFMMVNRTKHWIFFSPVMGQKREISSG